MTEPRTIADGLKTSLGEKPFAEIIRLVDDIVTVREESIVQAMRRIWEIMKLLVEPSGAVSYAAIVEGRLAPSDANIGIILSGGNLDLDRLPWQN
jgi:threonine dehydratase